MTKNNACLATVVDSPYVSGRNYNFPAGNTPGADILRKSGSSRDLIWQTVSAKVQFQSLGQQAGYVHDHCICGQAILEITR